MLDELAEERVATAPGPPSGRCGLSALTVLMGRKPLAVQAEAGAVVVSARYTDRLSMLAVAPLLVLASTSSVSIARVADHGQA